MSSQVVLAPGTSLYTIWCLRTFEPRNPGLSSHFSLRPALLMALLIDDNARDDRSVLCLDPCCSNMLNRFHSLYTLQMSPFHDKCALNYTAYLTLLCLASLKLGRHKIAKKAKNRKQQQFAKLQITYVAVYENLCWNKPWHKRKILLKFDYINHDGVITPAK